MRVKIWGARGSVPAPGPGTVQYGGNTSCVQVFTSTTSRG
jgi:phosphoribosyl 1,2-cyclic phosphodiesterase